MDKKVFNRMVDDSTHFSFQDKVMIQEEKARAPYSAVMQLLDLLCDKACSVMQPAAPSRVALYLSAGNKLRQQLASAALSETTKPASAPQQVSIAPTDKKETADDATDILKEINDYQEISFKTAPKSVILDKFLETAPCRKEDLAEDNDVTIAELGKKSIQSSESLGTETLAVILGKQGRFDRAIEIYTNLMSKYPEKSSTFAARIEELKNRKEINYNK